MSTIAVINCRPQDSTPQNADATVELEKQTIIEVTPSLKKYVDQFPHPTQRNIEDNTKEILEKIAEINKKQGLIPRREKPNYFHFPFSYSRSQQEKYNRERSASSSPFSNPILEYLLRTKNEDEEIEPKIDLSHQHFDNYDENEGFEKSVPASDGSDITKDDIIPGQYIKRKIVHQQTFAVPMQPNFMMPQNMPPNLPSNMFPIPMNFPQNVPVQTPINTANRGKTNAGNDKKTLSHLEKQTIDNIKNIVSSTQMQSQAYPLMYNPYLQYLQQPYPQTNSYQYQYDSLPYNSIPDQPTSNDEYSYRVYGPYPMEPQKSRQNWNWPGANYFPIYIRDPFLQFYNAITSMIEYGPTAGQAGPCKRPPKSIREEEERATREGKLASEDEEQIVVELENKAGITIYANDDNNRSKNYLDLENIDIDSNKEGGLKFTVSLATGEREAKGPEELTVTNEFDKSRHSVRLTPVFNTSRSTSKLEKFSESPKDAKQPPFVRPATTSPTRRSTISPPIRDPTEQAVEFDDEFDDDKSEDVSISNDGNKKMFSRDNTGSGIFIHKLKVRKGGVAIAGPGGIATAGSGGTAIVGPNGVAFTQPDSLAIAGSGTKVIAVDPTINLGDLINNTALTNKTHSEAFPPSRVGRVVAVGPVVYYNRG